MSGDGGLLAEVAGVRPVYILGAGFSRAISRAMPVTDELGDQALERSGLAGQAGVPESFGQVPGSFEAWLSRQAGQLPYRSAGDDADARARYVKLTAAIAQVLDERVQHALAPGAPVWLVNLLRLAHAQQAVLCTFNYDPLIEYGVADADLLLPQPPYTGLSEPVAATWRDIVAGASPPLKSGTFADLNPVRVGESLQLLKMHGSTNWYGVAQDPSGSSLLAADLLGGFGAPQAYDEVSRRLYVPGRERFVVPPTATKNTFYDAPLLREIWGQAARALQATDHACLMGYSLPATDMVTVGLLQDNLALAARVDVVDARPEEIVKRLHGLGFAHATAASGGQGAIASYVERLVEHRSCRMLTELERLLADEADPRVIVGEGDRYVAVTDGAWNGEAFRLATAEHWSGSWGPATSVVPGLTPAMPARELQAALERRPSGEAPLTVELPGGTAVPVLHAVAVWNQVGGNLLGQGAGRWIVLQTAAR